MDFTKSKILEILKKNSIYAENQSVCLLHIINLKTSLNHVKTLLTKIKKKTFPIINKLLNTAKISNISNF